MQAPIMVRPLQYFSRPARVEAQPLVGCQVDIAYMHWHSVPFHLPSVAAHSSDGSVGNGVLSGWGNSSFVSSRFKNSFRSGTMQVLSGVGRC